MSQPESIRIPCPLCGSQDLRFFCEDSGMTFQACRGCGLVFLNPRPSSRAFTESAETGGEPAGAPVAFAAWTAPRVKGFEAGAGLISRHADGGRLLDIGCGDGRFLHVMGERGGFELHGLEPDAGEARRASALLNLDVFPGTLIEAGYGDGYFDVVTMWDVLEHVYDPLGELREVRRILKGDGLLLARVPNLAYFRLKQAVAGRYLRSRGSSVYGPQHHLTYMNRATAGELFRAAGFEVESIKPSRSEYGVSTPSLAIKAGYHVAALALYFVTLGGLVLSVDLLILARPAPG